MWCQRQAQTGEVKPKARPVTQQRLKIKDLEKFGEFIQQHGDKTQSELAQLWDSEVSQPTISRAIAKIKHSRKKKPTAMSDESGMDERDNYGYGYAPVGQRFYALKSGRRQGRVNMI
ncbi:IS630 family transposase, partial [Trichocoleus sp. Lan]